MATAPLLSTPRLSLLPFAPHHLSPRYLSWLQDAEVVRYSDQRFRQHTLESCEAYRKSFEGTPHFFWAIEISDTRSKCRHIGNLTAYHEEHHSVTDVGILIGEKPVWGQGYGHEAWGTVCAWLLQNGTRKVTAGTLEVNLPMLSLMRRAGMSDDGRRRAQCLFEGRAVDVIHTALFAPSLESGIS